MFRPMLSATVKESDLEKLRFPLLLSPKLDGIRATVINKQLVSRTGKPIPNKKIGQVVNGKLMYELFDGELIWGEPTNPACFRHTSSVVMTSDSLCCPTFYVFDVALKYYTYTERAMYLNVISDEYIKVLEQIEVNSLEEVLAYEERMLMAGYEGIMLRNPLSLYKNGRSTLREHRLMKLKRFKDSEAEVLDVEERMHNENEPTLDVQGYTKRTTHQANKVGRGDMGALVVRDVVTGVIFSIGSGFDDALRSTYWLSPPIGQIVKYKYFPSGSKDKPRFPIFLGIRNKEDM